MQSLKTIGDDAFYGTPLTQLGNLSSLTTIGDSAFHSCTHLEIVQDLSRRKQMGRRSDRSDSVLFFLPLFQTMLSQLELLKWVHERGQNRSGVSLETYNGYNRKNTQQQYTGKLLQRHQLTQLLELLYVALVHHYYSNEASIDESIDDVIESWRVTKCEGCECRGIYTKDERAWCVTCNQDGRLDPKYKFLTTINDFQQVIRTPKGKEAKRTYSTFTPARMNVNNFKNKCYAKEGIDFVTDLGGAVVPQYSEVGGHEEFIDLVDITQNQAFMNALLSKGEQGVTVPNLNAESVLVHYPAYVRVMAASVFDGVSWNVEKNVMSLLVTTPRRALRWVLSGRPFVYKKKLASLKPEPGEIRKHVLEVFTERFPRQKKPLNFVQDIRPDFFKNFDVVAYAIYMWKNREKSTEDKRNAIKAIGKNRRERQKWIGHIRNVHTCFDIVALANMFEAICKGTDIEYAGKGPCLGMNMYFVKSMNAEDIMQSMDAPVEVGAPEQFKDAAERAKARLKPFMANVELKYPQVEGYDLPEDVYQHDALALSLNRLNVMMEPWIPYEQSIGIMRPVTRPVCNEQALGNFDASVGMEAANKVFRRLKREVCPTQYDLFDASEVQLKEYKTREDVLMMEMHQELHQELGNKADFFKWLGDRMDGLMQHFLGGAQGKEVAEFTTKYMKTVFQQETERPTRSECYRVFMAMTILQRTWELRRLLLGRDPAIRSTLKANREERQKRKLLWKSFDLSKGIDTLANLNSTKELVRNRWDFIYQHRDHSAVKRALKNLESKYLDKQLANAEQRAAEQRAAEQRAAEQRAAEQRAEQRAAEQRAEQRAAEQRAEPVGKRRMLPQNERMSMDADFSEKFIQAFQDRCNQRNIHFMDDDVAKALIRTIFEEMMRGANST